jgi:hypothetical protein
MKILDEKTLVPVTVVGVVFGAAMWLTSMWKQGEVNAAQIQELKTDIATKLDKIEAKVDRLIEKLEK